MPRYFGVPDKNVTVLPDGRVLKAKPWVQAFDIGDPLPLNLFKTPGRFVKLNDLDSSKELAPAPETPAERYGRLSARSGARPFRSHRYL